MKIRTELATMMVLLGSVIYAGCPSDSSQGAGGAGGGTGGTTGTGGDTTTTSSSSEGGGGSSATCGNGTVEGDEACDDGNTSNEDECLNDCTEASCGDGYTWDGIEECDDGNDSNTDTCLNTCLDATCGDGYVHDGVEACDDGNDIDEDECTNACAGPDCGDSIVQVEEGEECDDGNDSNTDDCLATCIAASCGDTYVQDGLEECDDGNDDNTDECTVYCVSSGCGDSFVQEGEECDDGNSSDTDACLSTCDDASCGDSYVESGVEQCDDGNDDDSDDCLSSCELYQCGDGYAHTSGTEPYEECDDGNDTNTDDCLDTCEDAACGDGYTQAGVETCDDQNTVNTDDCLNTCIAASCGDSVVWAGVEGCDDGNEVNTDECTNACALASCGDGIVGEGETCDDQNTSNTDSCLNTCQSASCGDSYIQAGVETCDDGNSSNTDSCAACQPAECGDGYVQTGVEECDDGNDVNTDTCNNSCESIPANDKCGDASGANAQTITLSSTTTNVTVTGTNVHAADDYTSSCSSDTTLNPTNTPDVVYKVVLQQGGALTLSLDDSPTGGTAFNGSLTIWLNEGKAAAGCEYESNLATCAAVNSSGNGEALSPIDLVAGTYFVVVDGVAGSEGDFTLTATYTAPSCGDGIVNDKSSTEECDPGVDPVSCYPASAGANACKNKPVSAQLEACPGYDGWSANGDGSITTAQGAVWTAAASTLSGTDDYEGTCQPGTEDGGVDHVYHVRPATSGTLSISIGYDHANGDVQYCQEGTCQVDGNCPSGCWASNMYVRHSSCTAGTEVAYSSVSYAAGGLSNTTYSTNSCVMTNSGGTAYAYTYNVPVTAGNDYYVFVDSFTDPVQWYAGPYYLKLQLQ